MPPPSSRRGPTTGRVCRSARQYLRVASAQLRAEALPILDNLVSTNAERARDRMASLDRLGRSWSWPLLGLAAVVVGQVWLARRFRRTINRGMLASSIVLLLVLVGGGLTRAAT